MQREITMQIDSRTQWLYAPIAADGANPLATGKPNSQIQLTSVWIAHAYTTGLLGQPGRGFSPGDFISAYMATFNQPGRIPQAGEPLPATPRTLRSRLSNLYDGGYLQRRLAHYPNSEWQFAWQAASHPTVSQPPVSRPLSPEEAEQLFAQQRRKPTDQQ